MKRSEWKRIAAPALLLALCALLFAGCGKAAEEEPAAGEEPFRLEQNEGRNAVSYPYFVRTASATWYFAKADMELLGEEAFLEGFRQVAENQEADLADAREALKGFIREEIPAVDIYTDFSGKSEESRFGGGFCYRDGRGIRLFTDWNAAGGSLLHEYVHYLSFCCTDTPVKEGFWAEALADYVSKLACENRMARAASRSINPEAMQFYLDHGAADPETGEFDLRRYTYATAESINSDAAIGQTYLAVSNVFTVVKADRLEHLTSSSLSYPEAACLLEYLIETYGRNTVFSHWDIDAKQMKDVFGKSFSELYGDWRVRNLARCEALGLILSMEPGAAEAEEARPDAVTVDRCVLYEDDTLLITLTGYIDEPGYAKHFEMLCENRGDKDLLVDSNFVTVNGWTINSSTSETVGAGDETLVKLYFYDDELSACRIGEIGCVEFDMDVIDADTWTTLCNTGTLSIRTSAYGIEQEYDDSGVLIRDAGVIKIVYRDYEIKDGQYRFRFYVENNSDYPIYFQTSTSYINGEKVQYVSGLLPMQKNTPGIFTVYVPLEKLNENGMDEITSLRLGFTAISPASATFSFNLKDCSIPF